MNILFYRVVTSFFILFVSINVFGQEKNEGNYQGMHWQITGKGYKNERCLIVDGETKLKNKQDISPKEIGGKLYFETQIKSLGQYFHQLYSIKGDKVISYDYNWLDFPKNKEGWDWVKVVRVGNKTDLLYTADLKLLHSNVASLNPKVVTFEGINGKFLDVYLEQGDELVHALYSTDWKLLVPIYSSFYLSGEYFNYKSPNGFESKLDKSFHWIGPSPAQAQQFEKIESFANGKYYKCKKNGYWGLYDSNLKEIVAPDYDDFGYFEDTNFIKFKLNGFWGVMTIQGIVTKTIIPTTRGYTNISRYVKSQKRFMYEMNGYKGECNHLGQQLSKIKVANSQSSTSVVSSSSSSSSSSRSSSSSTASSNSSSSNNNSGNKTTTVVVEHHRDPIPVQEWQTCTNCWGEGKVMCLGACGGTGTYYVGDRLRVCSSCNGTGKKICPYCSGQGGKNVTVYR